MIQVHVDIICKRTSGKVTLRANEEMSYGMYTTLRKVNDHHNPKSQY